MHEAGRVRFRCRRSSAPRRVGGWSIGFMVGLVFAASGVAATPHAGCWGTCGGDLGPIGGYFVVQSHKIEMFVIEEKCLGTRSVPLPVGPAAIEGDELGPLPNITIDSAGRVSFNGTTHRQTSHDQQRNVNVQLTGRFLTATKASLSLTIHYRACGTRHLTLHEG